MAYVHGQPCVPTQWSDTRITCASDVGLPSFNSHLQVQVSGTMLRGWWDLDSGTFLEAEAEPRPVTITAVTCGGDDCLASGVGERAVTIEVHACIATPCQEISRHVSMISITAVVSSLDGESKAPLWPGGRTPWSSDCRAVGLGGLWARL